MITFWYETHRGIRGWYFGPDAGSIVVTDSNGPFPTYAECLAAYHRGR